MATVKKADLRDAVRDEVGVTYLEAAEFVDTAIEAIAGRLEIGEAVKISGFGTFTLRDKQPRMGRNPKTGEPCAPRAACLTGQLWPWSSS